MEVTFERVEFLNRLRSLQYLCSDQDTNCPKALLVIPGPDGRFNAGSIHIIKYLFQGSIGKELKDDVLKEEFEDLEDLTLLIKEKTVSVMYSSKMKSKILAKVSAIPFLVEYTFTPEEESDIDKFQLRKCINFKRMVLEGLRDGDTVGITVPAAYDDIMEVEQWPLLQSFALDNVFKSTGFFTARYTVADVTVSVESLYRAIDGQYLTNAIKMTDSMIATYMQEMLTILDCPTITQRQRLSAEDIVGPLQVLFEFGELDASGVVENMMRPVVLFGPNTSELGVVGVGSPGKDWESRRVGQASHMVVESSEPSSGMRWCRSYFFGLGCNNFLLGELQKLLRHNASSAADDETESTSLSEMIPIELFKQLAFYRDEEKIVQRMACLYVKLCVYLVRCSRIAFCNAFDIITAATELQEQLTAAMTNSEYVTDKDLHSLFPDLSPLVLQGHERLQIHMDCMNALGEVITADEVDELGGACWIYIRVSVSGILLPTGDYGTIAIGDTFLFSPLVNNSVVASYSTPLSSSQHISLHVRDSFCVTQSVPYFRSYLGNAVEECYSRCVHHCLRSPTLLGEVLGVGKHMEISGMHTTGVTVLTNHPLYSAFKTNISLFSAGFVFDKVHQIVTLPSVVRFSKDVDRVWIVDVQDAITQAKATFYPHHSADLFSYSQSGILLIVGLKEESSVYELLARALKPATGYLALHVSYDDANSNVFREVLERWKPAFRMNDIVEYRGNDVVIPHKILSSVLDLMDEWSASAGGDKEDFNEKSLIRYASLAGQTNHNPVPGAGRLAAQCSHLLAEAQRLSSFEFQHLPAFQPKLQTAKSKTLVVAGQVGCGVHAVAKSLAQQLLSYSDSPQHSLQVVTIDFSAFDTLANAESNEIDWTAFVGHKLCGLEQSSSSIVMVVVMLTGHIEVRISALLTTIAAVSKRRIHQVISVLAPSASFSAHPTDDSSLGAECWKCQSLELLQPHCSDVVVAVDNATSDQQHTGYDDMRAYLTSAQSTAYLIKLSPQALALNSEDVSAILQRLQSTSSGISNREASSMILGYPLQCQALGSSTERKCYLYPVYNRLAVPTLTQYRIDNAANTWKVNILLKLIATVFFTHSKLPAYKLVDTWRMKAGRKQGGFQRLIDVATGKLFSKQHTQLMEQRLLNGVKALEKESDGAMKALSTSVLAIYGEVHMQTQRLGVDAYHYHNAGQRDSHVASIEANAAWVSLQSSAVGKQSSGSQHSFVLIQGMFTPAALKILDSLFLLCERISLPKKPILAASDVDDVRKVIQSRHEFEERELPFGWFFDGTFFLDSSGNKQQLRPDIADLVAEYVQAENVKIRRYNELLSSYEL